MNEDARENHTLRDALLITSIGAAAVGGAIIGGAKLIEKDLGIAKKYKKRATEKIIETDQNAKKTTEKILNIDSGTSKHTSSSGNTSDANIKKDPPIINSNNSTDSIKTTAEKIKEQQEFANVLMERFEAENNPALKAKLKEQIEAIKENIASYQLGNKK